MSRATNRQRRHRVVPHALRVDRVHLAGHGLIRDLVRSYKICVRCIAGTTGCLLKSLGRTFALRQTSHQINRCHQGTGQI
jgi:hypothetical protein